MNIHKDNPIGIFDSGIGGLTVANAVYRRFPNEKIIYFGDTAHLPYGDKSPETITEYCLEICHFLLDQKCKMIIIACNSASSVAYMEMLKMINGRAMLLNVIDPTVNSVIKENIKKVGVIGTKATIRSSEYAKRINLKEKDIEVHSLATPMLVPMIEEGYTDNNISELLISNYLSYPDFSGVEGLILACTHYPLVKESIDKFFKGKVKLFDSTDCTAEAAYSALEESGLLSDNEAPEHRFYVSDYTESFEKATKLFFKKSIKLEHVTL